MTELLWQGKEKIKNHHKEVAFHLLQKEYEFHSEDRANSQDNLLIHGDNLLALKSLLPQFAGKVNCIYIDPPYNTGNENWVYNDNVNDPKIQKWLGEVVGKEGEDFSRHDKWLCMMFPRLKLLKELLAENGVIFISIDDNEQANLKIICDEIFGSNNFVANFIWEHRKSSQNDTDISLSHNYIFCFAKNRSQFRIKPLPTEDSKFSNPDNDPRGAWIADPMDAPNVRENLSYGITNPNTGEIFYPPKGRHWRFTEEKYYQALADSRILFGKTGKTKPQYKRFLSEAQQKGKNPFTVWTNLNTATAATKELMQIFDGNKVFDTPKPIDLIEYILKLSTDKNSIILDSFSGSGTTAHAVLSLNKQDGGNRKFICIEMEDYAEQITAERIRRVIKGYGKKAETLNGTGGGFSFYKVAEPLFINEDELNPQAPITAIREYVGYTEGLSEIYNSNNPISPHALGYQNNTIYIFYYLEKQITTLDLTFLESIKLNNLRPQNWIIYADTLSLSEEQLKNLGIIFKKIPRDISKF